MLDQATLDKIKNFEGCWHTLARLIGTGTGNADRATSSVEVVDAELTAWIEAGFQVVSVISPRFENDYIYMVYSLYRPVEA